jgi:regulator of RNase E activity RraA
MAESEKDFTVLELQARWDKIRVANIYDTLDKMGYPDQVLDLGIRPLFVHKHLAGKAVTVAGGRDPRTTEEAQADSKNTGSLVALKEVIFPGAVLVIDCGGEPWAGKFGEMTSWNIKRYGAKGIVLDSFIRDSWGLEVIPDYTVCARGTSPIESYKRWRIQRINEAIAMPGTLTSQVRIAPGDWIVAEADGVIVIPQEIAMEALAKAEDVETREEGMRTDLAKGMSFEDCYKKWGRA